MISIDYILIGILILSYIDISFEPLLYLKPLSKYLNGIEIADMIKLISISIEIEKPEIRDNI